MNPGTWSWYVQQAQERAKPKTKKTKKSEEARES